MLDDRTRDRLPISRRFRMAVRPCGRRWHNRASADAVEGEEVSNPKLPLSEYRAMQAGKVSGGGKSKYRNVRTEVDGIMFDSKREAARYSELRLMEKAGQIVNLVCQLKYPLTMRGFHICDYVADFVYWVPDPRGAESVYIPGVYEGHARKVVEDVKGFRTDVYRLKKKLMKACCDIDIQEVE